MKKFLLSSILLSVLVGCSNKSEQKEDNPDISLNAGVGVVSGTGDFGSLGPKDSKILSVRIINTGDAALQGPPSIDNSNFSIIYQVGCASIAPGKACNLKISFSGAGKAFQSYSGNLNLDSAFLALSAIVVDPNPTQTASVSFSTNPLSFGTITDKQSSIKSLIVTNNGTTAIQNQTVVLGPLYSLLSDGCSNKSLLPNKSCTLRISLNGVGKSGAVNDTLSFASQTLLVNGQVVSASGPSELGSSDVKLLVNNLEATTHSFGDLKGSESKQVIVVAKNFGNKGSDVGTAQLLANSNFSIVFNQCNNRSLAPGASCQIRAVFSAAGKSVSSYTDTLSFVGKSILLSANIIPNIVITYQAEYSDFQGCTVNQACQGLGTETRNVSCRQYNNNIAGELVDNSNCPNLLPLSQSCSSPSGSSTVDIDNGSITRSCIAGQEFAQGTLISVDCDPSYIADGESCVSSSPFSLGINQLTNYFVPGSFSSIESLECSVLDFNTNSSIIIKEFSGPASSKEEFLALQNRNDSFTCENTSYSFMNYVFFGGNFNTNAQPTITNDIICYVQSFNMFPFNYPDQFIFMLEENVLLSNSISFGPQACQEYININANLLTDSFAYSVQPVSIETVVPEITSHPQVQQSLAVGDNFFVIHNAQDGSSRMKVYKVDNSFNYPLSPIYSSEEINRFRFNRMQKIQNNLIVNILNEDVGNYFFARYNSSSNQFDMITPNLCSGGISCSGRDLILGNDGFAYLEYFIQSGPNVDRRVIYKTNDGVNLELVILGSPGIELTGNWSGDSLIAGSFLFFLDSNGNLFRTNLSTGVVQNMSFTVPSGGWYSINDKIYVIGGNPRSLKMFDGTSSPGGNTLFQAPGGSFGIGYTDSLFKGNNYLYFVHRVSSSVADLHRLDLSNNTVSLVRADFANSCTENLNGQYPDAFVNPLNDNFIFQCTSGNGVNRTIRSVDLSGTLNIRPQDTQVIRSIEVNAVSNEQRRGNTYNYSSNRQVVSYKGKSYLKAQGGQSLGFRSVLVSIDENNVFSIVDSALGVSGPLITNDDLLLFRGLESNLGGANEELFILKQ